MTRSNVLGASLRRHFTCARSRFPTSQLVLVVLFLLLVASTPIPSPSLVGAQQSIDETAGGGVGNDPNLLEAESAAVADGPSATASPLRRVEPYRMGGIVVTGTTFASAISSSDVLVPVPDGTTPGDFTIMFIGDSGGSNGERASFKEGWTPVVDVGETESVDLNLKIQHKFYGGGGKHFNIVEGVNKFVILSSLEGIDELNPVVEVVAERFADVQEIVAPDVNTADGGTIIALYLLDSISSNSGRAGVSGIESPTGFEVLSSDFSLSGEGMSAFVAPTAGGGCTGPIVASFTSTINPDELVSGIAVSISLRAQGSAVESLMIPCARHKEWNVTREMEREELKKFFNSTGGLRWTRKGGWLSPAVEQCSWEGVGCNDIGLVTGLSMPRNNMASQQLPRVDGFQFLQKLDLSFNDHLGGTFDDMASQGLANLTYVALSRIGLSGTLGEIGQSLQYLDLSSNKLVGTVSLGEGINSTLTHLNLGGNGLEAVNVSQLTLLQNLDLSANEKLNHPLANTGIVNLLNMKRLILSRAPFTGELRIGHMRSLEYLDLNSVGSLGGSIEDTGISSLTNLTYIDLRGGNYSGSLHFCNFTLLAVLNLEGNNLLGNLTDAGCNELAFFRYINVKGNGFTGLLESIGNLSLIEYMDISDNSFYGPLPSDGNLGSLKHLDISFNQLSGTLPNLTAPSLRHLDISHNQFIGQIPLNIGNMQIMEHMDMSNQRTSKYDPSTGLRRTSGLSGPIPETLGQMRFLQRLFLSKNILTGSIPSSVALLSYLETIDFENNQIGGLIPASMNILEQLDTVMLANNRLKGEIPDLSGSREKVRTVTLAGNPDLKAPAPFILCDLENLDLRQNDDYCPSERSALAALYQETKGQEWLNNGNWTSEAHHCDWYGVGCTKDRKKVINLTLITNGVSGEIPEEFYNLVNLEVLDLNENDLRGTISSGIGKMKSLQYLRLSYNRFTKLPEEMDQLRNLSLLHLHGNRLTGDDSNMKVLVDPNNDQYQFISDCGDPQDAASPFFCEGCDMCCNSLEECQEPVRPKYDGMKAAGIVIAGVIACLAFVWIVLRILAKQKMFLPPRCSARRAAGDESVYSFILTRRKSGWLVAVGTVAIQVLVFGLFLQASDFSNDDGDFVYSFRCPRNTDNCSDERAVTQYGWVMWTFLVFASLLDDLANGIKLLLLSSTRGSSQCFVAGLTLFCITALAIYTSAAYNRAIAMTNTELIVNAVILLFVNDVDEQVFNIVKILNGCWLGQVVDEAAAYSTELLEHGISDTDDDEEGVKEIHKGGEGAAGEDAFDAARDQIDLSSGSREMSTSMEQSGEQRSMWNGTFGSKSVIVDPGLNEDLARKVELLQKQMAEIQRKMQ